MHTLIAEQLRPTFIVALDENAHPSRRERQNLSHLVEVVATRQQPERVKMALRDRIGRRLVAPFELDSAQMRLDGRRHDRALDPES